MLALETEQTHTQDKYRNPPAHARRGLMKVYTYSASILYMYMYMYIYTCSNTTTHTLCLIPHDGDLHHHKNYGGVRPYAIKHLVLSYMYVYM